VLELTVTVEVAEASGAMEALGEVAVSAKVGAGIYVTATICVPLAEM
jgi:hypothetical protein